MITVLERIFISPDMDDNRKRGIYGTLCGVVGIFLNLLLFIGKFLAGVLSNSIAITADAFNNLSDAGSSVMTLIGFRLASQKPDLKHPFGHGRMEYLAGLGVSALILSMGVELLQTSVGKIIHPTDTEFSPLIGGILIVSILVKCYMAYYNRNVGRKIGSATIEATATDSLSDCVATGVVLLSGIIGHFTNLRIDGYCGALVGLFICYAGINAAKETINPLLGQAPEPEFVEQIQQIVMGYDENILGMHDLIVHDYGPGRRMISLHAEVPAGGDVMKLHDQIDNIERVLEEELGCLATIHMDPIVTNDPRVNELKEKVKEIVLQIQSNLNIHDFRVVWGETHTNLIFDILAPFDLKYSDEELTSLVEENVKQKLGDHYCTVIDVDKDYNPQIE